MLNVRSIRIIHLKYLSKVSVNTIKHLIACGYQYDMKSGVWLKGRLQLEEWRVIESVILYLRENYPDITEKGVLASEIIENAKRVPQITITKSFIEICKKTFGLGNRISGKAIFLLWCEKAGIDLEDISKDGFELFMKRKSLLVNEVYDRLSMLCRFLGRKRINGAVKRNVFIFGEEITAPVILLPLESNTGIQDLMTTPLIRPSG